VINTLQLNPVSVAIVKHLIHGHGTHVIHYNKPIHQVNSLEKVKACAHESQLHYSYQPAASRYQPAFDDASTR
jgi:hypothetical protein